jgi:hypothetical protein
LFAGCATEPTRCGEAADALASCHGIDAATFLEACDHAPADEATAITDTVLAESCPAADGKADGLGEWSFVQACRPVIASAALVNQARNPTHTSLPNDLKAALRPQYGALVDRIRVHWNASLVDDWPVFNVKDAFMDVGAQTFGHHIYVAAPRESASLTTIAHELMHSAQAERLGGTDAFYREYCRAFYRAGLSYDGNALEIEARAAE